MIVGERLRLRRPERFDLPTFVRWFNDPEVTRYLQARGPMGLMGEEDWFRTQDRPGGDIVLCLETLEGRLIGNVGIVRPNWIERTLDLGIIIGERDCWSQGYGREALTMVLDYCFMELGMVRVQLFTDAHNAQAIRCYERTGFIREGVMRRHGHRGDGYSDDVLMAITRDDWFGSRD